MGGTTLSLIVALLGLGAAKPAAQETPPPTFRSGADVVVLDVVANDGKGRPLGDLPRAELQVSEDGKACEILSFRLVHARLAAGSSAPAAPTPPAGAGPGAAASPPQGAATPTRASLVVLLFDRLTTATAPLARRGAPGLPPR